MWNPQAIIKGRNAQAIIKGRNAQAYVKSRLPKRNIEEISD
jgi:hypothetical protein